MAERGPVAIVPGGMDPAELVLRLFVAMLLGAVIGYERHKQGHPAGIRTHVLVSLAAASFMVTSIDFVRYQHLPPGDLLKVDPSRIASGIVSGIGFVAGGAILRTGANVTGLTSAAALFLVAAVGMGAGSGMFLLAAFVTGAGTLSLAGVRWIEYRRGRAMRGQITVELPSGRTVSELADILRARGVSVAEVSYEGRPGETPVAVTLDLHFPERLGVHAVLQELERHPGVRKVRLTFVT